MNDSPGSTPTAPSVAAALIVRDAEATLARCLASVRDAVDEIVVVDTGSVDRTREIAAGYTDRLFDLPWRQNFAAARQYAFDQATADWVFWLDADDVVRNPHAISPMLAAAHAQTGLIFWRYEAAFDPHGNVTCAFWRERCARRGQGHWTGRIHETLSAPGEPWYGEEVVVEHRPEPGANNLARNIAILETALAEEGEDPRLMFYLGRDLASAGETDRARHVLERYLPVAIWDDEKYQAQTLIAELWRRQAQYDAAIDADLAAFKIHPTWPDAYFGLARTYYFRQDWSKVVHWSEFGEMLAEPQTVAILDPMAYRFHWIIYYTNALYHVGRIEDALRWTLRALEICPDDPWHRQNETLFRQLIGGAASAQAYTSR